MSTIFNCIDSYQIVHFQFHYANFKSFKSWFRYEEVTLETDCLLSYIIEKISNLANKSCHE